VDSGPLQRLRGVRQMGHAHLVYPGAVHTRFEHSLGTYDMARRLVRVLLRRGGSRWLSPSDVRCFLAASLLHDIGHYPFSHTLEELPADTGGRIRIQRHDRRAQEILLADGGLCAVLRDGWGVDPARVARVIDEEGGPADPADLRLREMLCGPLNPDRLDYLQRDSNHVGVPYGNIIDIERLLATLDFTPDGAAIGVSAKGVAAVETLIFASYLMYREVYWHHTVRAAQAMFKAAAAAALVSGELAQEHLVGQDDERAVALLRGCSNPATRELVERLAGVGRRLYRRVWSGSPAEAEGLGGFLRDAAAGDYWQAGELCADACARLGAPPHHLLVDLAGRGKELFFIVAVVGGRGGRPRTTADAAVSLIASSLHRNFDLQAKRMQVLAPAERVEDFRRLLGLA
jgi:HD superfamily phosphohydrolase